MASSKIDHPSATEFRQLFEVPLPDAYFSSETTAGTPPIFRKQSKRPHRPKAQRQGQVPRRSLSPDKTRGAAKSGQQAENAWTCASKSYLVPGIFLGHSSGQVWHWHAAELPAKLGNADEDGPDESKPQQQQQPPRRQILQLVCTHKGPVTALLGPASDRALLDPKAWQASRLTASTDDPPNASGLKPEAQLEQIFTGGHDGTIRVWETSRLGIMSRRLVACASLAQVLEGHQSTITSLAHRHRYLISSSTDCTILVWRTSSPPDAWGLGGPKWEKQEVLMTMDSWVTSISYAAADTVSDNCGQLFMADDTGMLAGAQPVVKDIRQAWLPASLISWATKAPTPPSSSRQLKDEDASSHSSATSVTEEDCLSAPSLAGWAVTPPPAPAAPAGEHVPLAEMLQYPAAPRRLQDRGAIQILFVPELNVLLTISCDSCMRLLEPATFGVRNALPHPDQGTFTAIACHVGHAEVLLADDKGWLMTYSLEAERIINRQQVERQSGYRQLCIGPTGGIVALHELSEQGSGEQRAGGLLSATVEGGLSLWHPNVNGHLEQQALPVPESEITSLTMAQDTIPVTGHEDGSIVAWNLGTGTHQAIGSHNNTVTCLAAAQLPSHGLTLLSSGYDGRLCMWAAQGKQGLKAAALVFSVQLEAGKTILSLLMDPGGSFILCGCSNGQIADPGDAVTRLKGMRRQVFYSQSLQDGGTLDGAPEAVTSLVLTPDWLVAGTENGATCQWSTHLRNGVRPSTTMGCLTQARQARCCITQGGGYPIVGLCVLPNPEYLASCTSIGHLRAWHLASNDTVAQLSIQQELTSMVIR
ncbi:hypothetical protein WJX74_010606 [Apatococcus lobatus]|uniref:Uncharacterized protein n=1 Tax=Apatococcus lobatus TaxID=904363 RepID=A0AAW1SAR6_9CHLO